MKNFWTGFEKQASIYSKIKSTTRNIAKNTDNVLDYAKMNKPKAAPGNTLNYAKMKQSTAPKEPLWKRNLETKRRQTVKNTPGVVHDSQRGVVRSS